MNKMNSKVAVYIIVALMVLGVSSLAAAEQLNTGEPKITWKVPTDKFLDKKNLTTYRAIQIKKIGHEQAYEMTKRFRETAKIKLSFEIVEEHDNRFIFSDVEDPSAVFDVDSATGAFLFNAGLKKYSGEGTTQGLPSPKDAPDLALKYLVKLGYLPENSKEMALTRVGGLGMTASKNGKSTEDYKKLVTVIFRRVLNELRVQGPGSRILVHLGEQADLVGMIRNWSEVDAQKVAADQLKNDELIRREIYRRLLKTAGQAKEIFVQKAELVLYDDGRGVIEPAFYVVAAAQYQGPERTKGTVDIPVDFYIPILLKPAGYYPFHQDAEAKWPGSERNDPTLMGGDQKNKQ